MSNSEYRTTSFAKDEDGMTAEGSARPDFAKAAKDKAHPKMEDEFGDLKGNGYAEIDRTELKIEMRRNRMVIKNDRKI